MLILPAEADEATVSTAVDRIAKAIAPGGGAIDKLDRWGRKRFAYEIRDQHEGYYVVVRFTGVKVKELVPDYLLGQAHQIVNVDLSAEDLVDRLRAR